MDCFASVVISQNVAHGKFRESKTMAKSLCSWQMQVNHVLVANFEYAKHFFCAICENKINS